MLRCFGTYLDMSLIWITGNKVGFAVSHAKFLDLRLLRI